MNKIDTLFKISNKPVLSIYVPAGYPDIESLKTILPALEKAGAGLVEIGMPFSDPLADGPVIQEASQVALKNGMSLKLLFEQLQDIKVDIPLILMGYLNPVMQFGMDRFLEKAHETGISGTILPDLPVQEYIKYQDKFEKYGIHNILLITPQSSDERIRYLASVSKGFLYLVSSSSTTGTKGFANADPAYFNRIREMKLGLPGIIGFGIKTREDFTRAGHLADGAIVGSQFIRHLQPAISDPKADLEAMVESFIADFK
jgi:tryptophan synthase alpha chain